MDATSAATGRVLVGTRGSSLALRQAEAVVDGLRRAWPGLAVEVVAIRTSGDHRPHARLAEIGGKGLFVKEIEEALLAERVDVGVHSLKDLPARGTPGLMLAAFPPREHPRDVLVSRSGGGLEDLPAGARVGTSSPRRQAQLLRWRADLVVREIRGNVETRLRKLADGLYEALVLARAGLRRLGIDPPGAVTLDPAEMLPAVGQGTLAIQVRETDDRLRRLVAVLDDPRTRAASEAERAFLEAIEGSCTSALAAHAEERDGVLWLDALVAAPDGSRILREVRALGAGPPRALGLEVADAMRARGAADLMGAWARA
jgi:hydroxymethylbilane synthase